MNIKVTTENLEQIINDMQNDVDTSRDNEYYFISNEINGSSIRQLAWDNNVIVDISQINEYNSMFKFFKILI
jgi:hypothetical protein